MCVVDIKLIQGLHVFSKGANGKNHYGVKVQSTRDKEQVIREGYQYEFIINTYTLSHQTDNTLQEIGLSPADIQFIRDEEANG